MTGVFVPIRTAGPHTHTHTSIGHSHVNLRPLIRRWAAACEPSPQVTSNSRSALPDSSEGQTTWETLFSDLNPRGGARGGNEASRLHLFLQDDSCIFTQNHPVRCFPLQTTRFETVRLNFNLLHLLDPSWSPGRLLIRLSNSESQCKLTSASSSDALFSCCISFRYHPTGGCYTCVCWNDWSVNINRIYENKKGALI